MSQAISASAGIVRQTPSGTISPHLPIAYSVSIPYLSPSKVTVLLAWCTTLLASPLGLTCIALIHLSSVNPLATLCLCQRSLPVAGISIGVDGITNVGSPNSP